MCRLAKDSRQRIRAGPLGLGLLVGLAVLSYGFDCGCTTAEILAINDEGGRPAFKLLPLVQVHHGANVREACISGAWKLHLKFNHCKNRLQLSMIS